MSRLVKVVSYKDHKAELSRENQAENFVGKVLGLGQQYDFTFHAKTEAEAEDRFHDIVDKYLNPEFKGQIAFRTSRDLHRQMAYLANRQGTSLNSFMEDVLKESVLGNPNQSKRRRSETSNVGILRLTQGDTSDQLFQLIEPFLNKPINIFRFPDALKSFLITLGSALEEIQPYLKTDISLSDFLAKVVSLIEPSTDKT
jgi:predicted HicB family RNase H-like nuclease